jgi:hypothetical protein
MDRNYRRKLAFAGWGLLACLAIGTGAGALRYALPNVPIRFRSPTSTPVTTS